MRREIFVALGLTVALGIPAAGAAGGTAPPDPGRGRILYERHCGACHTPAIHMREQQLPMSRDELRMLVDTFRRQGGLAWTRDDIDDVVEYLSRARYRFAPDEKR